MRNLCMACVFSIFFSAVALAQENNGVFVGLEMGMAEQQMKLKTPPYTYASTHFGTIGGISLIVSDEGTGQDTAGVFGIKLGYKHFFLEWIGIRGYASIDYAQSRIHSKGRTNIWTGVLANLAYSANADVLFNFYNSENVAFGAFVGLGVGGQTTWDMDFIMSDKYRSFTDLYSDVKVGLRVNVAQNHGMEFIAKIPLNQAKETFEYGIEAQYKQTYQVLLGYNFTF